MVLLALSLAGLAPEASAQTNIPSNSPLVPSGLSAGDTFRLLFVTSTRRNASSSDIADYNSFVKGRALAGHTDIQPFSSEFRVVGSTSAVSAKTNTSTTGTGVPIYWVNGDKVADNYTDFYDGSWDSRSARDEDGTALMENQINDIFTGSGSDGSIDVHPLGPGGTLNVPVSRTADLTETGKELHDSKATAGRIEMKRFYGLSPVLTVGASVTPVIVRLARVGSGAINEGGTVEFTVTLSRALVAGERVGVPVLISGTGVKASDWSLSPKAGSGLNTGVVLFTQTGGLQNVRFDGAGAQTATLILTARADNTAEGGGSETYTIALGPDGSGDTGFDNSARGTNVTDGANPSATASENTFNVTVNDVTLPVVTITAGATVTEGSPATFTVNRTGATTAALTVLLAVSENTAGGRDFVAAGNEGNKMVTIPVNQSSATYSVATESDTTDEPDGAVTVALRTHSAYTGGSPSSAMVTVEDDDNVAPTVANAIPDQAATVGTAFSFAFAANAFSDGDGDTLTYGTTKGDGSALPTWLTFTAATRTFSGTPQSGDAGTVTVKVTASDSNGGSVSDSFDITVSATTVVSITGGPAITEGETATFTVKRTGATTAALTVLLEVSEIGGQDFVALGNEGDKTVTIPANQSSVTYRVPTVEDTTEAIGAVKVALRTDAAYSNGNPFSASVVVKDNDGPPLVTPVVSIQGGSAITEGGTATFTLTASPAPTGNITVRVNVTDSGDFAASGQTGTKTVTIGTGGTASIMVTTVDDGADEPSGTITATVLPNGSDYSVGSSNPAMVEVTDDDDPPLNTPVVRIEGSSAITEGGTATFTLNANPAPTGNITVRVNVTDSGDFAASGQIGTKTVTIGTGGTATHEVPTEDDSADEPNGSITATVNTSSDYSPHNTNGSASVTVNDNDDPPAAAPTPSSPASPSSPVSPVSDPGQEQSRDRGALAAIYDATGGRNWARDDNWKTNAPLARWYGVTVNPNGRVTRLELEDNNLRGAVPLAQIQSLASLEELALWGNELTGDITDELGKRVDRAALRKIKEVNGSALADWFRGDDIDYSDWSGVEVNDNGRVTGLDLSDMGLGGELTEAVWEISELSELDLSENPDLRGEVPAGVMEGELEVLDISGSGVCAEESEEFEQWLESINFTDSENCGETEFSGGGSGGCFLASGDVSGERAYQVVIAVLVLAAVVGAGRIARAGR